MSMERPTAGGMNPNAYALPATITGRIPSKHFTPGRAGVRPRLIVLHTMEAPETEGRAHQVAAWFGANNPTAPQSSVHYCVDDAETWACVPEADTAWAVGQWEGNLASISIELAGFAGQSKPQWHDPYSTKVLRRAARLVLDIATRHNIPLTKLSPRDVMAGHAGLCGHVDITNAWHVAGGHTDPGPNFPWPDLMQLIHLAKNGNPYVQ